MSFLKDALKIASRPLYNPLATLDPKFYKDSAAMTKDTINYFKAPEAPKPTAAQKYLEAAQLEQLSKLNAMDNMQRKRLLAGLSGVRDYAGSPLFRALPSNTAGQSVLGQGTGGLLV